MTGSPQYRAEPRVPNRVAAVANANAKHEVKTGTMVPMKKEIAL